MAFKGKDPLGSGPDSHAWSHAKEKNGIKKLWSSKIFQLIALLAAIVAIVVSVPLGVCLSGDGRCGRTSSALSSTATKSLPLLDSAALAKPIAYPSPTVAPLTEDANPLLFQAFEWYIPKDGKHWIRLASVLPKLRQIGISAMWIPPPTKAATEGSIGYDVYDLYDLGEYDTHGRTATAIGNKEDLLALAKAAHEIDVGLVVDAALNQRAGADFMQSCAVTRLNPDNRLQPINPTRMSEVWVGFNYTARGNRYSNKTWGCDDFTAVDFDASTNSNGVFKIDGVHNDFATDVSDENGNFDYLLLLDVAYDNPEVREDVKTWGSWITGQLGASGFRLDAAKHISRSFVREWIASTGAAIKSGFQTTPFVAEYWTTQLDELLGYVNDIGHAARVFDVPLLDRFAAVSNNKASLATIFENSIVSNQPDSAVTIVGNHDTQLGQTSSDLYVQDWFRPFAYAFILLRQEGTPCIFYGDVYGVCDSQGHCNKANNSEAIGKLATARTYFAYGKQQDYNSTDTSTVGWVRQGDTKHPDGLAVTMSVAKTAAAAAASVDMQVGLDHAGETWVDVIGTSKKEVVIDAHGIGAFPIAAQGISVFVNQVRWSNLSLSDWNFNIYE